jgi:hypothetical protein
MQLRRKKAIGEEHKMYHLYIHIGQSPGERNGKPIVVNVQKSVMVC